MCILRCATNLAYFLFPLLCKKWKISAVVVRTKHVCVRDWIYIYADRCVIQTCAHQRPWANYLMWTYTQVLSGCFSFSFSQIYLFDSYVFLDLRLSLISHLLNLIKEVVDAEERRLLSVPLIIFIILAITDFLLRLANHSENLRSPWRFLFDWPIRCGEFFLELKNEIFVGSEKFWTVLTYGILYDELLEE